MRGGGGGGEREREREREGGRAQTLYIYLIVTIQFIPGEEHSRQITRCKNRCFTKKRKL